MSWNNLMNIVRLWFATDYSVAQGYSISQRAESWGLVFHLLVWNQIFSFVLSSWQDEWYLPLFVLCFTSSEQNFKFIFGFYVANMKIRFLRKKISYVGYSKAL